MSNSTTADDSRPRCPPRQVSRPTWAKPTGSDVLDFANAVDRRNWLLREAAERDHRWPNDCPERDAWDVVSRLVFSDREPPVAKSAAYRWGCRVHRLIAIWHPDDKPDTLRAMFNRANAEAQRLDLGDVLCPTMTGFRDEYKKLVDSAWRLFDGSLAYSGKPLSPMSLHSGSRLLDLRNELRDVGPRLLVQLEKLKAKSDSSTWPIMSPADLVKLTGYGSDVVKEMLGEQTIPNEFITTKKYRVHPEFIANTKTLRARMP